MGEGIEGVGCSVAADSAGVHAVDRWVCIPGIPGHEVSDFGCVRKIGAGANKSQSQDKFGYRRVYIHRFNYCVHRLVLMGFVGPCPPAHECAHFDGNPSNNQLSNLRWATSRENTQDTIRLGRFPRGSKQGRAKLDEGLVAEMRRRYAKGGVSAARLAEEYGVSAGVAHHAISGRKWTHVPEPPVKAGNTLSPNRGERHHLARLNAAVVAEMRALHGDGVNMRKIAKRFEIHYNTARMAVHGFTWKHV